MSENSYEKLRSEFAELCAKLASRRNREKRRAEAPGELDEVVAYPEIIRIGIKGSNLYVGTRQIVMREGRDFWKGDSFLITIDTGAKRVRYENLEDVRHRPIARPHHPHVSNGGAPCFGHDKMQEILNWFNDGMLAHVMLYSVMFLEVVRHENRYEEPSQWPRISTEEIACRNDPQNDTSSSSPPANSTQPLSTSRASGLVGAMRALVSRSLG